jgi:hypothetical protein
MGMVVVVAAAVVGGHGDSSETKLLYCILQCSLINLATELFHTQNIFLEPIMQFLYMKLKNYTTNI